MKKMILFCVLIMIFSPCLYAQAAKIVKVEGEVVIRQNAGADWIPAEFNMYLGESAQIKTGNNAECLVAFDEELENVLQIKENSLIEIEKLLPGKVYLPRGRVFSLIDNIEKIQDFEVRTPTAIAGVRGTGKSVESGKNGTVIKCFNGTVVVWGIDENGNKSSTTGLASGFGIEVNIDGFLSEVFELTGEDYSQWQEFKDALEKIISQTILDSLQEGGKSGSLKELDKEQWQDLRDRAFEGLRRSQESRSSQSDNNGGEGRLTNESPGGE